MRADVSVRKGMGPGSSPGRQPCVRQQLANYSSPSSPRAPGAAHLQRMRELTEIKRGGGLIDGLLADHGLFHLVQMVSLALLAIGLHRSHESEGTTGVVAN